MLLICTIILVHILTARSLHSHSCNFNSMCSCSSDQHDVNSKIISTISCTSIPFYKLPDLPQGNITQLQIVGSLFSSLEVESFAERQVNVISLNNNKLQHLAERVFGSMPKTLVSLDLSYNELDSIPFQSLKELRTLQWINFHGNQICSLNGDWSHMKNTLLNLFLGENDITELSSESNDHNLKNHHEFRQFKMLSWLNLDGNRIHKIQKYSLPLSLQTVSLSHNLIENFPLEMISTLPHLQWLYLRGNHIKTFPEHTFTKKLWLEKIDLGENYLKTLPKYPFNGTVYIRDLNLAYNDLQILTDEIFRGLKCGKIILSYNQLEHVETKAFHGIQDSLEYLDLDHNNFLILPHALSQLKSLKYLYVSSNSLSEIPEHAFENFCTTLKAVSFSGNHLSKIPLEPLQNCSRISHFNIAYNYIQGINESDFSNWGYNIKNLILANNKIEYLRSQVFSDLKELKELSLSFNPLKHIDAETFNGLDNLESLEISFTMDRDYLPPDIFKPISNLQWLSADNNNFNLLLDNTFDYLPEIRYLNLESNGLKHLPSNLFKSTIHSKLRDIRLQNNKIHMIHSETFSSLKSLESILLAGNGIKIIQKYSFNNLPSLKKIIASDNLIERVHLSAFSNLPTLSQVNLQNNFLTEFSFGCFSNISSPFQLNMSRNQISSCRSDFKILNLEVLDLRYNNFAFIPECLASIALLKKLYLDFNLISFLEQNTFMHLTTLEYLSLQQNSIMKINKRTFFGLQNLQILDLSKNLINVLHASQFSSMPKLRILNLSGNNINYLPKDIFGNTALEMLDLSYNSFSVIPSLSLSEIGLTLRYLSMNSNNIEHIDSTTFPDIPYLNTLNLNTNKLTILPDNVFTSLGLLQKLDLSSNPLRANFKELFHYAQNLKELNLANTGITSTPSLPLPNLIFLNLSNNYIEVISRNTVQDLDKLKYLDLTANYISKIPSNLWIYLPMLKTLILKRNPVKEITHDSFHGLRNLQNLDIIDLNSLEKFDSKGIIQIKFLSSLKLQTWPKIENFQTQLCYLLANLNQLRILKLKIMENILDKQLYCLTNRKIRNLEITGKNLKSITQNAFKRLTKNPDLVLKISNTKIEELPLGIFSNMNRISNLKIDLSNNLLTNLNPEVFYGNGSMWENVGTLLLSGGLTLTNNPLKCDCHLSWLGHWFRRWMRETLQSHNAPVEIAMQMYDLVKEETCTEVESGVKISIVQLPPEDISCYASALSTAPNSYRISVIFTLFAFVIFNQLYK